MLALIRTLGPVAALLVGLLAGGTIIGGLAAFYNVAIDNPTIIRETQRAERDACTIRTMDAANKAEAAERARQQAVAADALRAYQQAIESRDRLASQIQDQMEQGIADYEKQLAKQGRSCPLDDSDISWLRGK